MMERLNILWTTADKDTIESMLKLYAINALSNGWFESVNILIWGASTKLIAQDVEIQEMIKTMTEKGVTFEACKHCANVYNATDILLNLGVDVRYTGKTLTNYIKDDNKLITI